MPAALLPILALLKNPWVLLALACAIGTAGIGWYRMQYHDCLAERAADVAKAEKAKAAALEHARETSDAIITEQAQALAATAQRANTVREKVIYAPVTTACSASPAVRAATDGLRDILSAGGGDPKAERSPDAAVR